MAAAANIGPIVRRLRERWRLTQQDVVDYARLDRSSSYISSIETGKTSPTLAELQAIAIVLRTDVIALVREALGEETETPTDAPESEATRLFQRLPEEQQGLALDFLRFLAERKAP